MCVCCSGRKSARTRAIIATRRSRVSPRVCACVCGVAALVCVLERERVRVDIKYMCYFRTARTLNVRLRRSTTIFRLARNDGESSRAAWPRALREREESACRRRLSLSACGAYVLAARARASRRLRASRLEISYRRIRRFKLHAERALSR